MLLDAIRIRRPERRPEILRLIELVSQEPMDEAPQILAVEELVSMLGVKVSEELGEQLAARGDLVFETRRFHNSGPRISRQSRLFGFGVGLAGGMGIGGTGLDAEEVLISASAVDLFALESDAIGSNDFDALFGTLE